MGPRPGWLRAWRRDRTRRPDGAAAEAAQSAPVLIVDEIRTRPSTELKRPRYSIFTNNPRDRAASNIDLKKRTAKMK